MSNLIKLRGALTGFAFGAAVTGGLIVFFTLAVDKTWPVRLLRVFDWLALWSVSNFCAGCFPVPASAVNSNSLLILAVAIQWAIVGILWDLGRLLLIASRNSQ